MSEERRRIILLCSRKPIVAEFLLLAESIAREPGLRATVLVPAGLSAMLPSAVPTGCEVIASGFAAWRTRGLGAAGRYLVYLLIRRLAIVLPDGIVRDFLETWEANSRGQWIGRRLLRISGNDAALLIADDRDIRVDQGVLAVARDQGVFSMVVAFGKSSPEADALRRESPAYGLDEGPYRAIKQFISREYPLSVRIASGGRRVLFLRPGEYLALKVQDSVLPNPWAYGGGNADMVAVSDPVAAKGLQDLGVSKNKIVLAGQCSHDELWASRLRREELRAELNESHSLDAACKLLVFAMPVLGEHGMITEVEQQRLSTQLVSAMEMVAGVNVLVSLHPRQEARSYEAIMTQTVRLSRMPLRNIIAAADLFVAYSSTIEWAQLLGVPSVALECFGFSYSLFDSQPGVRVARRIEDVAGVCNSLLWDDDERRKAVIELEALQEKVLFDGRARERILEEIKRRSMWVERP